MGGYLRTAILLAGLTALFLAIGYLLGGRQGMVIAFLVACATNLWSWWNSDRVVLSMHNAEPIAPESAPRLYRMVEGLASGLQKLEQYKQGLVNHTAEAHPASAHMFIINPLSGMRMDSLFTTHPPTEERVRRLLAMAPPAPAWPQPAANRWGTAPRRNPWG